MKGNVTLKSGGEGGAMEISNNVNPVLVSKGLSKHFSNITESHSPHSPQSGSILAVKLRPGYIKQHNQGH